MPPQKSTFSNSRHLVSFFLSIVFAPFIHFPVSKTLFKTHFSKWVTIGRSNSESRWGPSLRLSLSQRNEDILISEKKRKKKLEQTFNEREYKAPKTIEKSEKDSSVCFHVGVSVSARNWLEETCRIYGIEIIARQRERRKGRRRRRENLSYPISSIMYNQIKGK